MEQGKVIIGCRLDSKELEKDLKKSEKDLEKYEKEAEKLTEAKAKIDVDVSNAEKKIDNLNEKIEQAYQKMQREKIKLSEIPSWKRDTEEYQKQLESLEKAKNKYNDLTFKHSELLSKYDLQIQKQSEINQKIESNTASQSMLNDKIQETSQKLKQVKGFENIKNKIEDVNKGLSQTIKKVAKWGIALFGIRTVYNAVRSAMSTLSQYDTQMTSNIEYIRYALASSLQPVIQTILNLVVKLLQYINYIAKAWTGKNLFKTADAFKNAQKNAKGLNKELDKTRASFDEMNILSDKSSGGGGSTNIATPNVNLTDLQGKVPEWLKWIVNNKDLILSVFAGVATGLLAWKLGLDGIKSFGLGLAIAGIVLAIQGVINYLKDPSWENFGKVITGIGLAVAGVAIIFGAWPVAVAGAIVAVLGIIISNWEKIKETFQNGIDWLKTKGRDLFEKIFGGFLTPLYDAFVNNLQLLLNFFDTVFTNIKKIFDNIIGFIKNVFTGNWKGAWENIKNIFIAIFDIVKSYFSTVFNWINNLVVGVAKTVGNILASAFKAVVNGVMWAIENILNSPIRTVNSLIGVINKIPGIKLGTLSTFKLPRLAKGGIINQPGKGIPVGNAIAGERGQEGVLPLTDSQQMQLLGEAIGRYITINASITNTMNGRVISRELQKVNNTNDFAFNR